MDAQRRRGVDPSTVPKNPDVSHLEPGAKESRLRIMFRKTLPTLDSDLTGAGARKIWMKQWKRDSQNYRDRAVEGIRLGELLRANANIGAASIGQPDVKDQEMLNAKFIAYMDGYREEEFVKIAFSLEGKGPITDQEPHVEVLQAADNYAFRAWYASRLAVGIATMQINKKSLFAFDTKWRVMRAAFRKRSEKADQLHMDAGASEVEGVKQKSMPFYDFPKGCTSLTVSGKKIDTLDPNVTIFDINVAGKNHELWVIKGITSIAGPISEVVENFDTALIAVEKWSAGSAGTRYTVFNPPSPRQNDKSDETV